MVVARLRSWLPVAGVIAAGLVLSYLAYGLAQRVDEERARGVLALRAEWRAMDFAHKIENFATVPLSTVAAFVNTYPGFTAEEFEVIARQARQPGDPILAILWASRVRSSERDEHETAMRRTTRTEYWIHERGPEGDIVPAGPRDEYFPVNVDVSFEGWMNLLGLDLVHETARRAAAERARDEGRPIATKAVTLAVAPTAGASYLVYHPVYRAPMPPDLEARRGALLGFVVGVFRVSEVLRAAIKGTPDLLSNIDFLLDDHQAADHYERTPVATFTAASRDVRAAVTVADRMKPTGLRIGRAFETLGQHWQLVFAFPRSAIDNLLSPGEEVVLLLGIVITMLLAAFVHRERLRMLEAESLATRRTADLKRAAREQEAVIDASLLAIIVLDPVYTVRVWNRAAERIFGFMAAEVIGKPYPLVPETGRAEFEATFARVRNGEIIRDMEVRRLRKDGSFVDVVFSGVPLLNAEGKLRGALFTLDDVTEKKTIQQQLAQAQKMEAVGQLTGGIAHDFNNVLGAVVGNLDLAVDRLQDQPDTQEMVRDALDAALRGAELVKRLLAFARKQPLQPQVIDVRTAFGELGPLLKLSLGEQISIETSAAADIWPVRVDPVQLQNAILNLAINARDAMPDGGRLSVAATNFDLDEAFAPIYPDLKPGAYVAIAVSDTGSGMSPEILARVFEPFFSTKGTGKGTGLGLSMVYGTIRQSGGAVKIYSEIGKGTTVRLFLPRVETAADDASAAAAEPDPVLPTGRERILVVEDSPDMRKVATGILAGLGYAIVEAENADEALRALRRQPIDLVFSDVVMPGSLDGLGLAREVLRRHPGLPVLLTSGFSSKVATDGEIQTLGAELIVKPYRRAELAGLVRRLLDRRAKAKVA